MKEKLKAEILEILAKHGTGDQIRFMANFEPSNESLPEYDHNAESMSKAFGIDISDMIKRLNAVTESLKDDVDSGVLSSKSIAWEKHYSKVIKNSRELEFLAALGVDHMKEKTPSSSAEEMLLRLLMQRRKRGEG